MNDYLWLIVIIGYVIIFLQKVFHQEHVEGKLEDIEDKLENIEKAIRELAKVARR